MIEVVKARPVIIFFALSLVIILSWLKDGLYYGGAEVGVGPYYNPSRYLDIQKFIWWGDVAPGALVPQFINAIPLYFILSILQKIFSPLILQALLFFSLLFLMGYGMYRFAIYSLGKERKNYAVLAGLFYMLNSYVLVEVWHRFLYTGIFLAAVIPILALFWQRWIREGRFIFLTFFLLTNLLFSYMYGNLTSLIAVWVLCFLITAAEMILPWKGKKVFLITGYKFTVGFLLFLLTNLWWLIPAAKVSTQILPQQHNIEDNIGTLVNISKQTILPFTLQYANPFYLFYTQELGSIYTSFIFRLLPWLPAVVIFIGVLVSLRNRIFASYGLFYLLAILIAKGAAGPFGYPYIWVFMKTFFIGVIRNPFEKLGILLPFFGSILFVIGLERLLSFFTKKFGTFIAKSLISIVLVGVLIYAFPMFTGEVFNKQGHSLKVKVPTSYELANEWFMKQGGREGNILHLPFSGGDVATYNWENGYHGVEINEILFTPLPSITRNVGIKRIDDTLSSLTYVFTSPYFQNQTQILETLQNFNVKFIVLHKDLIWQDKDTYGEKGLLLNPTDLEKILNNLSFLTKKQQFGDLVIYKLTDEDYKPTLSISQDVQIVHPGQADIMQILSFKEKGKDMITPPTEMMDDFLKKQTMIIFPDRRIENIVASDSAMISKIENIFTNQSSSPDIQQILEMRNYFSSVGYLQSSNLIEDLILATQEILRLYGQSIQSKTLPAQDQLSSYELMIKKFLEKYSQNLSIHLLFESYVSNQLRTHIFILRQLGQENTAKMIENFMVAKELLPIFRNTNGLVFKFTIPETGIYQLLSPLSIKEEDIIINGNKITSKDNIAIEEGKQEIALSILNQNLVADDKTKIVLKSQTAEKPLSGGHILSIFKESSVKFSGKIILDGPSFILFSQSYHPGWVLTLFRGGRHSEIRNHLIGNLYNNAWWVNENGEFNFNIEFIPQKNVSNGLILSLLGWLGLLIGVGFVILKTKLNKKI